MHSLVPCNQPQEQCTRPCFLHTAQQQLPVQGLLPIKTHRTGTRRSLKENDFEVAGSPIPVRNETDIFQVRRWLVVLFWNST
jgi:hypothetical protein